MKSKIIEQSKSEIYPCLKVLGTRGTVVVMCVSKTDYVVVFSEMGDWLEGQIGRTINCNDLLDFNGTIELSN